jgi:hypothetical protein
MGSEDGPYLSVAVICEKALRETDNVLSLIRIVDRWVVNSYTSTMAPTPLLICLVLALKNGKFRGSRILSVRPKAPSGTELQPRNTPVLFQGDDDGGVNVVFAVPFIVQETGTHWFEIFLDETFVTKLPLTVAFQTVMPDQPLPLVPPQDSVQ